MSALKIVRGKNASLQFADGTEFPCDFVIRQTTDAGLRLTVALTAFQTLRLQVDSAPTPVRLVGAAHDGRPIALEGEFLLVRARGEKVTYVCQGPAPLRFGSSMDGGGTLSVSLSNCFFAGTDTINRTGGGWTSARFH